MPRIAGYATYMLTLPRIIRSTPRAHFVPISSSKLRINPHAALHQYGSNHPLVGANPVDKSAFLTDSLIKDLVGWVLYAIGFSLYAFFTPIALGHPDNSIHANPLTTPAHIVPEWYFLAFYAILRSIPNKQAGVASVALVFFTLGLIGISGSDQSQSTRCLYSPCPSLLLVIFRLRMILAVKIWRWMGHVKPQGAPSLRR